MEEENSVNDFEVWYSNLIEYLNTLGKRAPYKGAWMDCFYGGLTVEEAAVVNESFLVDS